MSLWKDNINLQFITWNVANFHPPIQGDLIKLFEDDKDIDVYAIGMQEIPTGVMETAKSFISIDNWAKTWMEILQKKGFYLVENIRMQGLSLSIFSLIKHVSFIRFIKSDLERTGLAGVWGNKGGLAVSMWLYGRRICFLNTHLIPHRPNQIARVQQFSTIVQRMTFGETTTLFSHDCLFWFGDLNFRIDELSRNDVIAHVNELKYTKLLDFDQFKQVQKVEKLLKDFDEGHISFPPTYKFDVGSDIYDTSDKQRVPSWTDRVLCRLHPDFKSNSESDEDFVKLAPNSYKSIPQLKQSDHKPVKAKYLMKIQNRFEALVKMSLPTNWTTSEAGEIKLEIHKNYNCRFYDYIVLYSAPLVNWRSYKSWIYVPNTSEEEPESRELLLKFPRVEISGDYMLGYISEVQSCLLLVTEVFHVF